MGITRDQKIKALLKSGLLQRQVAGRFKISRGRVAQIARDWKPKPKPWWQTGREYTRGLVRKRDAYTCQNCGKTVLPFTGRQLDVHHLDGLCGKKTKKYDRTEDMDTLITLCHKCHYNHPQHSSNI